MNLKIEKELEYIQSDSFVLGEYIYMAMGLIKDHRVCIAVAYKIDYCIKKANQFVELSTEVKFTHINKVKVGQLEACDRFEISENKN